jgi:hypothetical protein
MRRLLLITALAVASASAQAGGPRGLSSGATANDPSTNAQQKSGVLSAQARDSRSLSTGAAPNDVTATTNTQSKPGGLSAQTDSAAVPALPPATVELPRYAPPPAAETPRYALPPGTPAAEAPKPVDTTRATETPAQIPAQTPVQAPIQTPVQPPAQVPVETQAPRTTARPAPVASAPVDTTPPSSRQQMPSRETRSRRGRTHHADYYGSGDWSDYGWDYGRPYFRTPHWSTSRIISALHRYRFYW